MLFIEMPRVPLGYKPFHLLSDTICICDIYYYYPGYALLLQRPVPLHPDIPILVRREARAAVAEELVVHTVVLSYRTPKRIE